MTFRPDIEGLRAIAILLVVAAHAGVPWLAGGFVGVDVFFVLSGFLITGKLVQEVTETGKIQLLPFYVRRLRRLLPALLLMLLLVGLASRWLVSPSDQAEQFFTARMAGLWLSNFYFALANLDYFAPGSESNLYLHTWSLGVEEQFYLIWPALVLWLVGGDGARGISRLKIGMLVVTGASLLACLKLTQSEPLLAFYMMPLRAWQFAAGALVWLMVARNTKIAPLLLRAAPMLGLSGLLLIVVSGIWLNPHRAYPGIWALIPTLGASLVVLTGSLSTNQNTGAYHVLSLAPLQWLGRISYSWYLWHWPVLLLGASLLNSHAPIHVAALVVISLVLAALSHQLVEAPLRHWKQWLAFPRAAVLASLASMAIIGLLANHWTGQATRTLQSPEVLRYQSARGDAPIIYRMNCDDWYHSAEVRICAFGDPNAERTAVLFGDSHAGQWFPTVYGALDVQGIDWRLLVITKSACPLVDEPFFYARIGRIYTECSEWRKNAVQQIKQMAPDLVVMGSTRYDFNQSQWTEGSARLLSRLSQNVGHIFLLADTPHLPFDGPNCLMAQVLRPAWLASSNGCTAPAASSQGDAIRRWLSAAAARFANVTLLDMTSIVCPDGLCRAELDSLVTYRDSQHLSGSFAESLADQMKELLIPQTSRN